MRKELLDPTVLRKLLRYEPETGKLFWRERTPDMFPKGRTSPDYWNSKFAGKEAFTSTAATGYRQSTIYDYPYLAHRVIWAIVHGEWPKEQIDHINGVREDNRLDNLRAVTPQENNRNTKRCSRNTSGATGVSWHPGTSKWRASIYVSGKHISLGLHRCVTAAITARKSAEKKYGFHENHGRTA